MSTSSWIGFRNKDKTIRFIYCHHDGYIKNGVGETLVKHYSDPETINKLLDLGDLSALGTEPVENLLNDFIEKKSNLRNKDINSYKTPNDLYQALVEVELSDRQKERKIRKDIRGAKKVGSTANFDIYVPETYEASCALGKGSGWCTADSRTREYYDEYLRQYGGRYYILISKDGKYRYQVHFESDQYSAAGTNPDIGTPNQEEMLDHDELFQQWPELDDFFANETDAFNAQRFLTKYIAHMWGTSDFDFLLRTALRAAISRLSCEIN